MRDKSKVELLNQKATMSSLVPKEIMKVKNKLLKLKKKIKVKNKLLKIKKGKRTLHVTCYNWIKFTPLKQIITL